MAKSAAIKLPAILAAVRTPGNSAPGCVPAPTNYRFGRSCARLCGRSHAGCVRIGSTEKAKRGEESNTSRRRRGSIGCSVTR